MPKPQGDRIAWFTPLSPVQSGISYYNEELLPILAASWRIDLFVDGYEPANLAASEPLRIFRAAEFARRDQAERYRAVVYHMGNGPAHAYMYQQALRRPGILVLHDTLLHHLVLSMLLHGRKARQYRSLMERRYGEAGHWLATRVMKGQLPPSVFQYPLSEDLIEASQSVVVHSAFSKRQVLDWCPDADVSVVPMGVRVPEVVDPCWAREQLGIQPDAFLVSSITHVNPYKRLDIVLRAIRRLKGQRPVKFVIAGTMSPLTTLTRLIAMLELEDVVDVRGFVTEAEARLLTAASDVIVNLRYPTAGETSASLLRTMGAGKPVLVSDAGTFSDLPDDAVVKIPVDALEEETVFAMLDALAPPSDLARRLGENARSFIVEEHNLNVMVAGYHEVLSRATGRDAAPPPVQPINEADVVSAFAPDIVGPLWMEIGGALTELGLDKNRSVTQATARAVADLGLRPAKMSLAEVTSPVKRRRWFR